MYSAGGNHLVRARGPGERVPCRSGGCSGIWLLLAKVRGLGICAVSNPSSWGVQPWEHVSCIANDMTCTLGFGYAATAACWAHMNTTCQNPAAGAAAAGDAALACRGGVQPREPQVPAQDEPRGAQDGGGRAQVGPLPEHVRIAHNVHRHSHTTWFNASNKPVVDVAHQSGNKAWPLGQVHARSECSTAMAISTVLCSALHRAELPLACVEAAFTL
jgi:hypothetical protein